MAEIFCAIDTPDMDRALAICAALSETPLHIKLGLEFFAALGPQGVMSLRRRLPPGKKLFLDLKLHDIPNTVAGAVRGALSCGADFLTVHASGGPAMLAAAQEAAKDSVKLLAVTVLTHLDDADLETLGQKGPAAAQASRLAALAHAAGLAGIVCAPTDLEGLRSSLPAGFLRAVPGIRPAGADRADQKRVMTPAEAVAAGADILVVGRPVTQVQDPRAAALGIWESLARKAA
jgi:orotidine-5'-phosphate decarboxylase